MHRPSAWRQSKGFPKLLGIRHNSLPYFDAAGSPQHSEQSQAVAYGSALFVGQCYKRQVQSCRRRYSVGAEGASA